MKSTLLWLSKVTGKTKLNIVLLLLVQTASAISSVAYALCLKDIINAAVDGERRKFFYAVFYFALLVCFLLALQALKRYLEEATKSALENRMKQRLFSELLTQDFASVTAIHSGEWMNRLTSDTVVVANGMTEILPGVMGMVVRLVAAAVMIVLLEPRFLYLIVPGGILLLFSSTLFRRRMKLLHKRIQEEDGRLRVFLQETLASLLIVRSYGVESETQKAAYEQMKRHKKARMRRNHFSNFCNIGFGMAMNGAYVLGALFCGYGILTRTMSYGNFMAILQLIGQVQSPFANISGYLPRFYAMIASAERLIEGEQFLSSADETVQKREALDCRNQAEAKRASYPRTYHLDKAPAAGERISGQEILHIYQTAFLAIGLSCVSFTYLPPVQSAELKSDKSNMPKVLKALTLEIHKGEFTAFTGASGCGKSTVLKLFLCLYPPDSGRRYLKLNCAAALLSETGSTADKESVSIEAELDERWQRLFAYVPQGNFLMSGTIREIVSFADRACMWDEARIRHALKVACADFVFELKEGVDTLLGERGLGISEGQMQRLAIARAIFSERPVLMLDEATSALDELTERQLLTNLRQMTDKTVLIVTHRPQALEICDKIVRFDEKGVEVQKRWEIF